MKLFLISFTLLLLFSGCGSGNPYSDVETTECLSSIDSHTTNIDNGLAWAIEHDSVSNLNPLLKETEGIRDGIESLRIRIKAIVQERDSFKEELKQEGKLVWVDLIYRLAPVALGTIILLIGRFLTQDPADTKFGIACFLSGIAINAFYDTIGNWGIIAMITLGIGWFFYSHEKKDLAKRMTATTLEGLK